MFVPPLFAPHWKPMLLVNPGCVRVAELKFTHVVPVLLTEFPPGALALKSAYVVIVPIEFLLGTVSYPTALVIVPKDIVNPNTISA